MIDLYPPGPQTVPAELTRPSSAYRQRAWLAVTSLAVFLLLYAALAGWFVWTAYRMLGAAFAGGQDVILHALIGGCAAFLAIFMLKALLFLQRGGAPDALEVTAAEQPRLFEFLHRLADEAGAPRPKRVFLSARVNAAVFYDLSVMNLLFPSQKNLEIGLALVNVLTLSEIKAVLAHEFGHFAQRSMAIGSWVYIAQQIAGQIVARRDALDRLLQVLSRIDLRIAWIGWLLSLVVWSIRSLMDTLLGVVVLAQRALSRQMEFQADLVAVSLTGSDELVHALHKLNAADEAWGRALGFADAQRQQGRLPHDLFAVQSRIIERTAQILADDSYGQVPKPAAGQPGEHRVFKSSFAQPPQMWSTHPASADREDNAKRCYLPAPHDPRSAWLLFDDVDAVRERLVAGLYGETEAVPASAEQTFEALDRRYACLQYQARYRGAYLGRPLTSHAAQAEDLIQRVATGPGLAAQLAELYPEQLAQDLARLRELAEERAMLEALHDRQFEAAGGRIVHRGRNLSRRGLPAAIRALRLEEDEARERILDHDRRCRGLHLAAAEALGDGWQPYLGGLIGVLHYAEHTQADLQDAHGVLANVYAVVTADGKVSGRELKRLLAAANALHAVLVRIHQQRDELQLDASLCGRLGVPGWAEMLGELTLPPADKDNIGDWLAAIDDWVHAASGSLGALAGQTLEQLLLVEDLVARNLREEAEPGPAPAASQLPVGYPVLLPGQERKRQTRLGWWDRFKLADGVVAASARLLVAGAIVGSVLGFGNVVGVHAELSIYNGLGQMVTVSANDQRLMLAPFSARRIELPLGVPMTIEASAADGSLIERFNPEIGTHARHFVYNVAGASPLIESTVVYGSAAERAPRLLGAPRWTTSTAQLHFTDPPRSVRTKRGATRTVLSGVGERSPEEVLSLLGSEAERVQVIRAHARWDKNGSPHADGWRRLAEGLR
jgi:Zn-dependent protease with chaperone function